MATKITITNAGVQLLTNLLEQPGYTKKPGEQISAALLADALATRFLKGDAGMPVAPKFSGDPRNEADMAAYNADREHYAAALDRWDRGVVEVELKDREFQIAVLAVRFHSENNGKPQHPLRFKFTVHSARLQHALKLSDDAEDEDEAAE